MEFRILGPLEVVRDGRALELGGRRQRAVLALLLLRANEVVSSERLIEELWAGRPPATAANTVQAYVSRLRKALGGDGLLVSQPPGYVLRVPGDCLDLHGFNALVGQARAALAAGDPGAASELLSRALALWRGPPLFDFLYEPFAQAEIARLEELRLDALELRIDADLALGRHARLVAELESLVGLHPFREGLRGQLMLALYRSGRQADALDAYRNARATLVEELGLEPSPDLQRLERAILEHDPQLHPVPTAAPGAEPVGRPPEPGPSERASRELRKTVTVLFTDVAESTAHGEGLDPEAMGRIAGRYSEVVRPVVERHGGEVQSSSGGPMMAVFGTPALHEDDALRAVRAADEIRRALESLNRELEQQRSVTLTARMGINTGEVLTGGEDAGQLIIGDSVNVAVRLQQLAAPGEILLGGPTYRLVRDWVEAEDLGQHELRGKSAPVRLWRVIALAPSVGLRALDLRSPLVARERELTLLRQTFERAESERTCHLVTVIGPAGIGKSRLVHELLHELGGRARVLRGRCLPYGAGITFWPAAEIVREAAGIADGDSAADAIEKLSEVLGEQDGNGVAERIAALVGLTPDPVPAAESFWAIRRLLQTLAQDRAVVVVVDDIHWAEPTLLELIEHILDWSHGSPMMLLCMARHELFELRPGWGGGKLNAATLALEPLTEAESGHLIENLLGGAGMATGAWARIVKATGGNPLFVEEVLRTLIEDDVLERSDERWVVSGDIAAAAPPPTINALLAARLDRLSAGERTVIESAAVIGDAFEPALVAALCPEDVDVESELMALVRRELIRPGAPVAPAPAFRFRHILIREVAYRSIPKRLRAELHERLTDRLEQNPEALQSDRDEILGYHLEQVCRYRSEQGSTVEAATLTARAVKHLAAAGRRALARGDHAAAAGLLTRASELPRVDLAARVELLPDLGAALVEIGRLEQADTVFGEAIQLARATGRHAIRWRAAAERAVWHMASAATGRTDVTVRETERAIRELTKLGDDQGLAEAWRLLSDVHNIQGRQQARADALRHALEHARRAGDVREEARSRHWLGSAMLHGPTPLADVLEHSQQDLTWAQAAGDRSLEATTLCRLGMAHALAGCFDQAREELGNGRAICEELGLAMPIVGVAQFAGFAELRAGDPAAAERELRAGYEACNAIGEHSYLSTVAGLLAHALIAQGKQDEGLRFAALADEATASDDLASQILSRSACGKALAHSGDTDQAEVLAREAVALADSTDLIVMQADAYAELAEILTLAGRDDDAAEAADQASQRFDAKGVAHSARPASGQQLKAPGSSSAVRKPSA